MPIPATLRRIPFRVKTGGLVAPNDDEREDELESRREAVRSSCGARRSFLSGGDGVSSSTLTMIASFASECPFDNCGFICEAAIAVMRDSISDLTLFLLPFDPALVRRGRIGPFNSRPRPVSPFVPFVSD